MPAFARTGDGPSGLHEVIIASRDATPAEWNKTLDRLGLSGPGYRSATTNLRELLTKHGNDSVATFADCLL